MHCNAILAAMFGEKHEVPVIEVQYFLCVVVTIDDFGVRPRIWRVLVGKPGRLRHDLVGNVFLYGLKARHYCVTAAGRVSEMNAVIRKSLV